jgi:EpsI family protein
MNTERKLRTPRVLYGGRLLLCLGFAYYGTFSWLLEIWKEDEYSHGYLVLPICLYLVWRSKERLSALTVRPSVLPGVALLLIAAGSLVAGRAGVYPTLEGVSLLLVIPGMVLFLLGWDALKALAVPILYLNFMVPWYDFILNQVRLPFQLLAATIGTGILQTLGYPVHRAGKFLTLPACMLEVAPECSGVAFLTSILAIGLPLVYLTQKSFRRAALVLASSVAIAFLFNGVRVAFVGIMVEKYGEGMSHGPFHVFQGLLVAQVGVVVLLLINWAVERSDHSSSPLLYQRAQDDVRPAGAGDGFGRKPGRGVFLVGGFLVLLGLIAQVYLSPVPGPAGRLAGNVPYTISDWRSSPATWIPGGQNFPGVDEESSRVYAQGTDARVFLYVGRFATQTRGKTVVNYRDQPLREHARRIDVATQSGITNVNLSHPRIEGAPYVAAYWYVFPDAVVAGRLEAKVATMWETVRHRRNEAAVVIAAVRVGESGEKTAEATLLRFVGEAWPALGTRVLQ